MPILERELSSQREEHEKFFEIDMCLACLRNRNKAIVFESPCKKSLGGRKFKMTKATCDLSKTVMESH